MYVGNVHQCKPMIPPFPHAIFIIQSAGSVCVVLLVEKIVFNGFIGKRLCFLSVNVITRYKAY